MTTHAKHLVIVAGEASGDAHAAHLVDALKKLDPQLTFSGLGGEKMLKSGVHLYTDLTRLAVVGFIEVLKHYCELKGIFDLILEKIKETNPAAVILVDYPGFNLRLAQKLKAMNVKVIYYISPQVWAWKKNRIKTIRQCVGRMLALFEFEKQFYAKHNLDVDFVGHPLVDEVRVSHSRKKIQDDLALAPNHLTIGILPGSRQKEIDTILPVMIEAAKILRTQYHPVQFLLFKAPTISRNCIDRYLKNSGGLIQVVENRFYDGIHACDVCMVTSGTATLETAILNKPMVVVYKTSFLTWALARLLIKIPYIGLVNVVAGEKIIPECIQFEATGPHIAQELSAIISNEPRIATIKSQLKKVKESLGESGASERAARVVMQFLNS